MMGNPSCVGVKVLDRIIFLSEFELHSRYNVHFQTF